MQRFPWPAVIVLAAVSSLLAQEPTLRATLVAHEKSGCVAFSPDGKTLAAAADPRTRKTTIELLDVATCKTTATLIGHNGVVHLVTFSPDGRTLASSSADWTIKLWDVATGKNIATVQRNGYARPLVFSRDGTTLPWQEDYVDDGKTSTWSDYTTIRLLDVATGKSTSILHVKGHATTVAFSPDGKTLALEYPNGAIELWSVRTGRKTFTLKEPSGLPCFVFAFSPDGNILASGGQGKTAKLWEVATGKNTATLSGHESAVCFLAFSPDGKTLAACGGRTIKLWDVATGKNISNIDADPKVVVFVAFSPDGETLASTGDDGVIKLWNVACVVPARAK